MCFASPRHDYWGVGFAVAETVVRMMKDVDMSCAGWCCSSCKWWVWRLNSPLRMQQTMKLIFQSSMVYWMTSFQPIEVLANPLYYLGRVRRPWHVSAGWASNPKMEPKYRHSKLDYSKDSAQSLQSIYLSLVARLASSAKRLTIGYPRSACLHMCWLQVKYWLPTHAQLLDHKKQRQASEANPQILWYAVLMCPVMVWWKHRD